MSLTTTFLIPCPQHKCLACGHLSGAMMESSPEQEARAAKRGDDRFVCAGCGTPMKFKDGRLSILRLGELKTDPHYEQAKEIAKPIIERMWG